MPASTTTASGSLTNWVAQLDRFFSEIESAATAGGWIAVRSSTEIEEDPFNIGSPLEYEAPILKLTRTRKRSEQRITFEPRHRFTSRGGSAGQIDVYSYPGLREAMLLRIAKVDNASNLTWDEAEARAASAPWKAYSPERLPLEVDFASSDSVRRFLEDLVA